MITNKIKQLPFVEQMMIIEQLVKFLDSNGYKYVKNYLGVPINIKPKDKHIKQAINIVNKRIKSR